MKYFTILYSKYICGTIYKIYNKEMEKLVKMILDIWVSIDYNET